MCVGWGGVVVPGRTQRHRSSGPWELDPCRSHGPTSSSGGEKAQACLVRSASKEASVSGGWTLPASPSLWRSSVLRNFLPIQSRKVLPNLLNSSYPQVGEQKTYKINYGEGRHWHGAPLCKFTSGLCPYELGSWSRS